jgi:AAA+ ATPase superfamily predicted ATPase
MSRDDSSPVPKMDLAPKLKRPLSLWNPLDYLLLLYWVFFFPQALRWYEENFGDGTNLRNERTWKERWQWLHQHPIQQQLIWQSLILLLVVNFGGARVLELLGLKINWIGVAGGVAGGVYLGVAFGVLGGIAGGVAGGMAFGVDLGIVLGVSLDMALSVASGIAGGVALGVAFSVDSGVALSMAVGVAFCVALGVALGVASGIAGGVAFGMAFGMAFGVTSGVAVVRPERWFLGTLKYLLIDRFSNRFDISNTPIPIPLLSKQLNKWLRKDWEMGLHNVNQLLAYTLQFIPAIQSVNQVLARTPPEQLFLKTAQLATNPFDWDLLKFASASLSGNLKSRFIEGLFFLPNSTKRKLAKKISISPRIDTPAHAVAAGFWYLYLERPIIAKNAFDLVTDLPYGEEMQSLANTLALCDLSEPSLSLIAAISLPPIPSPPHLCPASWVAIASFHRIIADIQVVNISTSRSARSFALNRALGELDKLVKHPENLDGAEKNLILKIARNWQAGLLPATSEIGEIAIIKPVQNPYIIGDPVQGSALVGREDTMNQLSELWLMGRSVQSVVLYGHRRMGKTSILRNINSHIGASVHLVYVNLLLLSNPQGEADVLMFICDEIQRVTGIEPPGNSDFAAFPENTCRRYIQQVCDRLDNQKLIIALDEFEQIENFIKAGKISPDFLQFLRGLVQLSPKIAFAFAGLHTLEEMTADYFHPFFASVIPIRVGFLSIGSTRQLLANPDPDFLLDYQPDTLDEIYQLTAGQPYLTQLVGFQLVRHYNNQVFERGRPRDPVFTTSDLHTVIDDPEFFDRGRYYFTGIWQQAAQDIPHQQAILKAIAPAGLTLAELSTSTNLAPADLEPALRMLDRHDVICYKNDTYYIAVELFRRWVIDRSPDV